MSSDRGRWPLGGAGRLLALASLLVALLATLRATFLFWNGLGEGNIETGESGQALLTLCGAMPLGLLGLGLLVVAHASGRPGNGRPWRSLLLVASIPAFWLILTFTIGGWYAGAMSPPGPAGGDARFTDTAGVVLLLGGCGGVLFGGIAVSLATVLLRRNAPGKAVEEGLSTLEGD